MVSSTIKYGCRKPSESRMDFHARAGENLKINAAIKLGAAAFKLLAAAVIFIGLQSTSVAETPTKNHPAPLDKPHYVNDLAYGEVLFEYYQNRPFASITRTLVAQRRNQFTAHQDHAELLLGSLYIAYGLLNEAENIFSRLIDNTTQKQTRDQAWFYLATLHYKRGDINRARSILNTKLTDLSKDLANEKQVLSAILLMKEKRFDEAVDLLTTIPKRNRLDTYAKYNMAVAFASLGKGEKSNKLFDDILEKDSDEEEIKNLREKSALALGVSALNQDKSESAIETLSDIRLNGPFSNPALLGLGWAHFAAGNYQKSLTPWTALKKRKTSDQTVQESYLQIPTAYERLGGLQNALSGYIEAKNLYNAEQTRIRETIKLIGSNQWLDSLSPPLNYAINPMEHLPPFTPATNLDSYYLYQFFAQNEFNTSYQNYRELQRLKLLVNKWRNNLPIYYDMVNTNRQRLLDITPESQRILEEATSQHAEIRQKLDQLAPLRDQALKGNNAIITATPEELSVKARLDRVEAALKAHPNHPKLERQRAKLQILAGLWSWDVREDAGQRYWNIRKANQQVNIAKHTLENQLIQVERAKEIAETRFDGFDSQFDRLSQALLAILDRIDNNLMQHEQHIQTIASEILQKDILFLEKLKSEAMLSIARLQDKSFIMDRVKQGLLPDDINSENSSPQDTTSQTATNKAAPTKHKENEKKSFFNFSRLFD